jgi:hypothetical protein
MEKHHPGFPGLSPTRLGYHRVRLTAAN